MIGKILKAQITTIPCCLWGCGFCVFASTSHWTEAQIKYFCGGKLLPIIKLITFAEKYEIFGVSLHSN